MKTSNMGAYVAWLLRRDEQRSLRRERLFRSRITIRDVPEHIFERYYSMPKEAILGLCDALAPSLRRPTMRSCALPVDVQVLLALRFYASGSFQSVVGDVVHLSQASASRVVNSVSQAIVLMATEGIRFPTTRRAVSLTSSGSRPFSENIAICNPESIITELTVKWKGSTHDSYMWRNCNLYDQFAAGTGPEGWLLGDAGYSVQPWLMTPIRTPKDQPVEDYNEALTKTRQVIERTFGILKTRFRCLDKSGGVLQYRPKICCRIIVACVVLHNYCRRYHVSLDEPLVDLSEEEEEEEEEEDEDEENNNNGPRARRTRRARPMVAGTAARGALVRNAFT
ncbi:hypothetical protein HPB47_023311 [Ixodes persulcatus]|uniref:Uncharacterized protein n=1 Tax=Ixodes persulcatus TaxID=34615 RepID=A0AC60Q7C0_IXOPE|nr:hypothetical protein HPB47_023311 [Ixodes persulcatus]